MKRIFLLFPPLFAVALTGANCAHQTTTKPRTAAMRTFGSAEELRAYLASQALATSSRNYGGMVPLFAMDAVGSGETSNMSADSSSGGSTSYSTTNIQEVGVDESDVVKNDGQTIFALVGNKVHITQAIPPAGVTELATVTVDANGDSLYLQGTRLIVLSREYGYYYGYGGDIGWATSPGVASDGVKAADASSPWSSGPTTTVTIFDVTNPASPSLVSKVQLQGNLASTRLIGNSLHLVVTSWPQLPSNPTPAAINAMPVEQWIPDLQVSGPDGSAVRSGDVATWADFYGPVDPDGYEITTVATLDVTDPAATLKTTAISANAGTIYASTQALYITDDQYSADGQSYHEDTMIHKFAFTADATEYIASGLVAGRPLNQYSLGEHQDYLRIATTISNFSPNSSGLSNNVYVLGASGTSLNVVGKIEDIAQGERIYAARFIGERGFLVTYRRIDPLFTLDLHDPANPVVAGELKVPGYSDHIQLLDANHLLTVGKDTQDAGTFAWMKGVQLSVFDVTDLANPTLLHKEVIGTRGTSSEANYEPKAFNYFAPLSTLALPIDLYEGNSSGSTPGSHTFTGLYVYKVTVENGFQLLGRIPTTVGPQGNNCYQYYYGYTRGIFIDDAVYSVTKAGIKAAVLPDASTVVGQTSTSDTSSIYNSCYWYWSVTLPGGTGVE